MLYWSNTWRYLLHNLVIVFITVKYAMMFIKPTIGRYMWLSWSWVHLLNNEQKLDLQFLTDIETDLDIVDRMLVWNLFLVSSASFSALSTLSMERKHFWHTPMSLGKRMSSLKLHTLCKVALRSGVILNFFSKHLSIMMFPDSSTLFVTKENPQTTQIFPSG